MGCQLLLLLAEGCHKEVKLFRQEKKENKSSNTTGFGVQVTVES